MDINELREQIDSIDSQLAALFEERMKTAAAIAEYKKEHGLPVFNRERERQVLNKVTEATSPEIEVFTKTLYQTIFDLSRTYQKKLITPSSELSEMLDSVTAITPKQRPKRAVVACQGVEGAYSQYACDKLFAYPSIMYFSGFEDVFKAVESGLCRYGILPLENSTAGSVNTVYDLMKKYKFYIVHSTKLCIGHSLLAPAGATPDGIKEIFSHEQALNQCSEFIKSIGAKATVCPNTAAAAKMIAESGVQNTDNNYTRFICISKNPEIYPGAKKTSVMLTIPHKPGSLYNIISKFAALGLNMTKLESRPIPGSNFEFMFYFDIEASVYSENLRSLLCELEDECEQFIYLGSYTED